MNCEAGDLALIVKARNPKILGMMVTCVQRCPYPFPNDLWDSEPCWEIDRVLMWGENFDQSLNVCPDFMLMPIRPLKEDEEVEDLECLTS